MKTFKVGVFESPRGPKGGRRIEAYTVWYNPTWSGCCQHTVDARNGTEAKKLAIAAHVTVCAPDGPA